MKLVVRASIIAVVLNLVLPVLVSPMATEKEKNACIKDSNLTIKEKFMIMLLHHKHMPIMSSIIVALVVALSIIASNGMKIL